jgi:4-alpha-glucanotransferase
VEYFSVTGFTGIDKDIRRENPNEERINIPADPKHYWGYRMHLPLENLLRKVSFNSKLKTFIFEAERLATSFLLFICQSVIK